MDLYEKIKCVYLCEGSFIDLKKKIVFERIFFVPEIASCVISFLLILAVQFNGFILKIEICVLLLV